MSQVYGSVRNNFTPVSEWDWQWQDGYPASFVATWRRF